MGFPIRKSADQSFLAAPHGLSQRSTSFIASQRQGIHRMPLFHLIALIINAHSTRRGFSNICVRIGHCQKNRKTNLFQDRPEGARLNNAWMWIAARLITTNDLRIDLLFTMSDNKRSSGQQRPLISEKRKHERALAVRGTLASARANVHSTFRLGGARRNRTDDLLLAKQALSQLSYGPARCVRLR